MMKKHHRNADIINVAQIMGAHTQSATREGGRCMGREANAIMTAFIEAGA